MPKLSITPLLELVYFTTDGGDNKIRALVREREGTLPFYVSEKLK